MLSYKSTGIKKLIFDRLCQIDEAIVEEDPEYRKLGEGPDGRDHSLLLGIGGRQGRAGD